MAAIIKNGEIFIKSHDNLLKINLPDDTIAWYYSDDNTVFALKDKLIMNGVEIPMDNTGLVSLFVKNNMIVRFFPKHFIMTVDGVDHNCKSSIKNTKNIMSITIKVYPDGCKFHINENSYTISPECITMRGQGTISREVKFLSVCESGNCSFLWKRKDLNISYYMVKSDVVKYIITINNNPNVAIKLEPELIEKVISPNCIIYNSKYLMFKNGETIILDDDEKPYLP